MEKAKAFEIPSEAWYAPYLEWEIPHIMIGFYYENEDTEGEFRIDWEEIGPRIKAYSDSWEALSKMPELIELLAKIDREKLEYTIDEFANELIKLGYRDITKRKNK